MRIFRAHSILAMLVTIITISCIPCCHYRKKNNNGNKNHKNNMNSKNKITSGCPKLSEIFNKNNNKKVYSKRKCKLTQCDVTVTNELCMYRTIPKKEHCLLLNNLVQDMIPIYRPFLNRSRLSIFKSHGVKEIVTNTCSKRISFTTIPQGNFTLIPNVLIVNKVEGSVSFPLPFGDYHLLGAGEWQYGELKMKIKFMRESPDQFNIKGYSETEQLSVKQIAELFDVDILPNGPMSALLKNIDLDTMIIRDCRVYGFVQPSRQKYELAFSGEPSKDEFAGSRMRVFITKSGAMKNLALLLELQDFSPVTLLKKIYGPSITRATILRDRNQTIAMYVSSQPTSNFSATFMAHGSARWIHRDSIFDPGVYMLVTIPFPKRKAVDMKIKLQVNTLEFTLPDSEKLYSNLALDAILPKKIMHVGVDRSAKYKSKDDKMYSKIRILRLTYFLFNNTYLAATESHLSTEDELAEIMPDAKPLERFTAIRSTEKDITTSKSEPTLTKLSSLEVFFSREQNQQKLKNKEIKENDLLTLAKEVGLL